MEKLSLNPNREMEASPFGGSVLPSTFFTTLICKGRLRSRRRRIHINVDKSEDLIPPLELIFSVQDLMKSEVEMFWGITNWI